MKREELDEQLDSLIKEAFEQMHEKIEVPDSTASWNKVKKTLDRRAKQRRWMRRFQMVSVVVISIAIGAVFFGNTPVTKAFDPVYDMVKQIKGDVVSIIFGSSGDSRKAKTPPPTEGEPLENPQGSNVKPKTGMWSQEEVSLEEAQAQSIFHVYYPSYVPSGFEHETIVLSVAPGETKAGQAEIDFRNHSADTFFRILLTKIETHSKHTSAAKDPAAVKEVNIRDQEGYLIITKDHIAKLEWMISNSLLVTVIGNLSEEQIIKVSESLK